MYFFSSLVYNNSITLNRGITLKVYDEKFMKVAEPIISHSKYKEMQHIKHHDESVYKHSISVAYDAYLIAIKLDLDWESVVRGALLHDFYLYKFKKKRNPLLIIDSIRHATNHPKVALANAKEHFHVNEKEKNIIKGHMFPFGLPRYKEAWVVTYCDKYIACIEYYSNFSKHVKDFRHRRATIQR